MSQPSTDPSSATDVFKALGDPIRWSIIQQIAVAGELACSALEYTLPISKPSISYHTRILGQAGLIVTRKRGRKYFYTLRRDVFQAAITTLQALSSESSVSHRPPERLPQAVGDERRAADRADYDATPLTW